eukprot:49976-Hanusia_phi.AAC.1
MVGSILSVPGIETFIRNFQPMFAYNAQGFPCNLRAHLRVKMLELLSLTDFLYMFRQASLVECVPVIYMWQVRRGSPCRNLEPTATPRWQTIWDWAPTACLAFMTALYLLTLTSSCLDHHAGGGSAGGDPLRRVKADCLFGLAAAKDCAD